MTFLHSTVYFVGIKHVRFVANSIPQNAQIMDLPQIVHVFALVDQNLTSTYDTMAK